MRVSILIVFFFVLVELASARSFLPKSFEAQIEQQNISLVKIGKKTIKKTIKSDIEMKYMFPSNIVFDLKDQILYVCNSKKTWSYTPGMFGEAGEVKIGDSSKYCYSKLFDTLANGLKDNKLYKVKSEGRKSLLTLSQEVQDQLSLSKLGLTFKKPITKETDITDLKVMEIYRDGQKNPTLFLFQSINTEAKLDKKDFIFTPPKKAKIKNI